jgi:hypothetical protein
MVISRKPPFCRYILVTARTRFLDSPTGWFDQFHFFYLIRLEVLVGRRGGREIKRKCLKTAAVLVCLLSPLIAQVEETKSAAYDSSRVGLSRLSLFSSAVVVSGVAVYYARYEPLWKDHYTSFFFREDFIYARNQDKLLHFYGSGLGSVISAKGLSWAGCDERDAALYGAATSLAFFTFMKIEDGHVNYLGFDRVDEAANILGAGYPAAQYYFPWLRSFTPKASYVASRNSVVAEQQDLPGFLEDHEGQKFWMGITVHDVLPEGVRDYWPPILGIAAGYTVRGLNTPHAYHETIVALDLDLRKLPGDSPFLKNLWEMLNYIHLPMPAVRVSPSAIWYGLYF